jgi:hypothetical protein
LKIKRKLSTNEEKKKKIKQFNIDKSDKEILLSFFYVEDYLLIILYEDENQTT